jgi:TRAP-type C4-dicarboxylate transport system permease small subunit
MAIESSAAQGAAQFLARLADQAGRFARYLIWAGGALILVAAVVVTLDVLQRKVSRLTGLNISGSDEISGYLFAISTTWAFSHALLHRANVRVDALYLLMPRPARAIFDVIGILILSIFVAVVTWHGMQMFIHNLTNWSKSITPLLTPLAIPQFFWIAGLVIFVLNLFLVLLRVMLALLIRDYATIGMVAGARTQEEEFEEEMRSLHLERAAGQTPAPQRQDDPTEGR